jgi:hypothetical protein
LVGRGLTARKESVVIDAASRKGRKVYSRELNSGGIRSAHGIIHLVVLGLFDLE